MRRTSLVAAAAVLAACGGPRVPAPAVVAIDPPVIAVDSAVPEGADAIGVTLAVRGRIANPNPFPLTVSRFGWAVEVEGRPAGAGRLGASVALSAGGEAPVTIPVRLRWADVPDFLTLLATRRSVGFRASGAALVEAAGAGAELPWAVGGTVDLPLPPDLAFGGARVREASLFQTIVDLSVEVRNPNDFPLPTGRIAYDLTISGVSVASAASQALAAVPARGAATVLIPVRFSTLGAVAGVLSGAAGGRGEVALAGRAGYGALEVAVDARASLAP
jgi:LEA14-like dessication related protein